MSAPWPLADLLAAPIMAVRRNRAIVAEATRVPPVLTADFGPVSSGPIPAPALSPPPGGASKPGTHPQSAAPASAGQGGRPRPGGWLCIEFIVPGSPRGWQRDTPLGYGRSVKTAGEAAYQRDIARYARQAKAACGIAGLSRGGVRLAVVAHIAVPESYGKTKRADCLAGRFLPILKPDFDNIVKSVADALTGVLWVDDKQVVAGSCIKVWAETPSLHVRVQEL